MENEDVVGEVAYYKSVPNVDKGRRSKNLKNLWMSYVEAP